MSTVDLAPARARLRALDPFRLNGRVSELIGLVVESRGPEAAVGERCEIVLPGHRAGRPPLQAEVVGFREGRTLLMPLGDATGIAPGQTVIASGGALRVDLGQGLLGRVLDGLGRPVDGGPPPRVEARRPIDAPPPDPLDRPVIRTPLPLGVRAIDTLMPCGRGQRIGIFAGSGVGKSTTMGMMARGTTADVNVIALVGERGREVREFIENDLGPEGLARSVVVVATSDQPALVRIKAAFVATTIAEWFRDGGADVLLMMDSVTRLATAQREVGLAIGEPPATRGYTPSVFAMLPRLLERAGTSPSGSITALYTVLVDGDDMNEPVADAVRSILDGHVVLSRELAHRHHYPAIDVLQSVSRLAPQLLAPEHLEAGGRLRGLLAAHKRAEDLIAIGAYIPGSDPRVDEARAKMGDIDAYLRQGTHDPYSRDEALGRLLALTGTPGPVVAEAPGEAAAGLTGAFNPLPPGVEVVPA
ncbi:FliI/YscN family ATPase [Miltoncostaea marina]|uniref:FliI/YscN family ATPase n=1 Tax=Miltoncostaea marina TaxID=2843215 RepID=UPI001C3C4883|nr:FliI/YscN family ATPase [Miltoncostaea marina]